MLCVCTNYQLIRDRDSRVQVLAIPNCNDWLHIPGLSPVKWTENAEHLEKYCRNKTYLVRVRKCRNKDIRKTAHSKCRFKKKLSTGVP